MKRSSPYLSVVIPALNAEKSIGSLLVRVFDSKFRDFEVIVVDDASTDRTGQIVYEFCEGMMKTIRGIGKRSTLLSYREKVLKVKDNLGSESRVIRNWKFGEVSFNYHRLPKRGGAARARNEGARLARGEVILLFDSDVLPMSDLLEIEAKYFRKNPKAIAVTGFPGTVSENMGYGARYKYWRDYAYWYIENDDDSFYHFRPAVGAIRRKLFWKAGGYDERYPGATMEDMEFSYRLSKLGRIIFDRDMIVAHPFGDLIDLVRTYFQRSYYYMELFLQRKKFTGVAMTGHEAYTIITAAMLFGTLALSVLFSVFDGESVLYLLILSGVLLMWFVYLQKKFLELTFQREGMWFTVKSVIVSFVLYIVICFGGMRFLVKRIFG